MNDPNEKSDVGEHIDWLQNVKTRCFSHMGSFEMFKEKHVLPYNLLSKVKDFESTSLITL